MEEFLKALENGTAYDWISEHGYEFSKDELISIIKEYDDTVFNMEHTDTKETMYKKIYNSISNNC